MDFPEGWFSGTIQINAKYVIGESPRQEIASLSNFSNLRLYYHPST